MTEAVQVGIEEESMEKLRSATSGVETLSIHRLPDDFTLEANGKIGDFNLADSGIRNLASHLGIDSRYAVKCPSELLADNANYWLDDLRSKQSLPPMSAVIQGENHIQHFLTSESDIASPRQLIDGLHRSFSERGMLAHVDKFSFGVDTSFVNFFFPTNAIDMGEGAYDQAADVGDLVAVGMDIEFSPIQTHRTRLGGHLHRLICTNGMTTTDREISLSFNSMDNFNSGVAEFLDTRLTQLNEEVEKFRQLKEHILQNPIAETLAYCQAIGLSKKFTDAVIKRLDDVELRTMYDLVNLVTNTANTLDPNAARWVQVAAGGSVNDHISFCGECRQAV